MSSRSLTPNQRRALRILAQAHPATVAVSNITHTGRGGREGVNTPGIAASTARWLVRNGYGTGYRYQSGQRLLPVNRRPTYVGLTNTGLKAAADAATEPDPA